ncbi:MAG: C40 family peptidase [Brachymonas sp.]|nr:C40 family peptidase [Brachymonas sp.]
MDTCHSTSQKTANCLPELPRRRLLLGASLGVAAWLLAGCGSAPRRVTQVLQPPGTRRGSVPIPNLPASSALQLDAARREEAVARAMLAINAPYRYGGNTLETGFDCSGLVQYVFSGVSAGRLLPRSTIQWARASQPIDEGRLQRGDLVFFNTLGAAFSHMGIYIGGREFVHAPSSGKGVRVDSLDKTYFLTRFNGARTVFAL